MKIKTKQNKNIREKFSLITNNLGIWLVNHSDLITITAIFTITFLLGLIINYGVKNRKPTPCSRYVDYSIGDLPIRCFDYFGIKSIIIK